MKEVISCSRRTDIPSCHYQWLQDRLAIGKVVLVNSFNQHSYVVSLAPEDVHSIVLWSKNFKNVIENPGKLSNYNLYFQFTINGYSDTLEPGIPKAVPLVAQMQALREKYSAEQIMWRFDPIIISDDTEPEVHSLAGRKEIFEFFCQTFSRMGIRYCTISFVDMYEKTKTAFATKGFNHRELTTEEKIEFSKGLVEIATKNGMQIYTCCEPLIENVDGIKRGHCVDGVRLTKLFGNIAIGAKDKSQRADCGCTASRDIGDYKMKCDHKCVYCYAQKH